MAPRPQMQILGCIMLIILSRIFIKAPLADWLRVPTCRAWNTHEGVPEERWISSTFPPNSPRCLRQGQVTEAWLDFLVDMQVGDQGDRSVDHLPGSGNDT